MFLKTTASFVTKDSDNKFDIVGIGETKEASMSNFIEQFLNKYPAEYLLIQTLRDKNLLDLREKVVSILTELNEKNIPEEFIKENVKGQPGQASNCPINNYMRKQIDFDSMGMICTTFWDFTVFGKDEIELFRVKLPDNVVKFRRDFDWRKYPSLISNGKGAI